MKKIVGIDIGGSSVKLAYFAGSTLKKAAMAPLPDNMVADGRISSMDAMADFLRQAARDNGIPLTNAAVVLPSTEVFTRELTMPAMTEQQLRYNLPYEFRDFLTDEKSKYYFDYSMRDILRDQDGYPTEMTLLACAMLKETAERYRAMMRRAGFKLQVLTPSECAYASVLAAYYRRTGLPQRDMCIVNLGYTAAYLYIYRGAFFESRREDPPGPEPSGAAGSGALRRGYPCGPQLCAAKLQRRALLRLCPIVLRPHRRGGDEGRQLLQLQQPAAGAH